MSKTTSDNASKQVLPVGIDSRFGCNPHELHLLSTSTTAVDTSEAALIHTENSLKSKAQSTDKTKLGTKKSLIRYFIPFIHRGASSVRDEHDRHDHQSLSLRSNDRCDMRFLIIRHGERADRYYGPNWYMLAFDRDGKYTPYHQNLPPQLPHRSNKYLWAFDTPLTLSGTMAAEKLGQVFGSKKFHPTYVYSSPATRCILTTIHILKGLGLQDKVPIRIEPGLLELGASRFGMGIFFQPSDWSKYGINVDLSYQPLMTLVPSVENERAYYLRSKCVIRGIEKCHDLSLSKPLNILIIAHATSPDTLTWDLIGKRPKTSDLYTLSSKIDYLQTIITERQPEEKNWSLKLMKTD